jgi:hypothetical protein
MKTGAADLKMSLVIARSEGDEAIQTAIVERFWIASLALAMTVDFGN